MYTHAQKKIKKGLKFNTWINQPLFSKDFTLRNLIKLVLNKEGSHSDPVAPIKLKTAKKFILNEDDLVKKMHNMHWRVYSAPR